MKQQSKLRGGKNVIKTPKAKPKCPVHHEVMKYSPSDLAWRCPVTACRMVSHPSEDISGRPNVVQGPFQLMVIVKDSKPAGFMLRSGNLVADITEQILSHKLDGDATLTVECIDYLLIDADTGEPLESL